MLQPLVIAPQSMLGNTQRVSCPARKGPASAEKQAQRMSDPLLDQGIDSLKNVLVLIDVLCWLHLPVVLCRWCGGGLFQKADPEESLAGSKEPIAIFQWPRCEMKTVVLFI